MTLGSTGTQAVWPLVGRDEELRRGLEVVQAQSGRGLVVVGAAGVGKTRLMREIASCGAEQGTPCRSVVGSVGAARIPLGACSHLLPATWQTNGSSIDTWRQVESKLVGEGAVALLVDDAHWLDEESAGLVHHLVTTGSLRVVVAARAGERLHQSITALWKDDLCDRLDLSELERTETSELLDTVLGATVEPNTASELHRRSGGNLLLLRELVDGALGSGTLRLVHGAWVQTRTSRPTARLVDLLGERLDGLDDGDRDAAELLAIAEPVPMTAVPDLIDRTRLARLVAAQLVDHDARDDRGAGHSLALTHPLLGEVLLERMPGWRRDELVARAVEAFEAADATADAAVAVRVALWRLDAGLPLDPERAVAAAEVALDRCSFDLAAQLARTARTRDTDSSPAIAGVLLGEALLRMQRFEEAEATFAQVAARLDELTDDEHVRYAVDRALALSSRLGRFDDAVDVLERTRADLPQGKARWSLEARLADLLADCGRVRAAQPLAEARLVDVDADPISALWSVVAAATGRTLSGRSIEALELCDRMTPVALAHGGELPAAIGWIAAQRMLALYGSGRLEEAAEFAEVIDALTATDLDPTRNAAVMMFRGLLAADTGSFEEALRMLRAAAARHEVDNRRGYQSWCLAVIARVEAQRGRFAAAQEALAAARASYWPAGQVFAADLDVAAMWVAGLAGDVARRDDALAHGLERAEEEGITLVDGYLRHEAIRLGDDPRSHLVALERAAEVDQGVRSGLWFAHARGLAEADADLLMSTGTGFEVMGALVHAAETYAGAAAIYQRRGTRSAWARAQEARRRNQEQCPGVQTPMLAGSSTQALTGRELEIAIRVARGESNRGVAEALGISVRTVEAHVQRSFVKLGVNRRVELAEVLLVDP